MGNKSSLLLREEEIAQIQEETGCKYLPVFMFTNLYLANVCARGLNIVYVTAL